MGEAKIRKRNSQAYLAAHPVCVFCGGSTPATTVEHCPPRALFIDKSWPEGFEFPACAACNQGTSNHDSLVTILARGASLVGNGNEDGRLEGLLRNANRQYPGLFSRMKQSATNARKTNRIAGVRPGPGLTHQDIPFANILPEHHEAVASLAAKLTKGLYYRESGQIFPNDGCLLMHWFTNLDLFKVGSYPVFELMKPVPGELPKISRAGRKLNHQFECKITSRPHEDIFILQAAFGMSFGFVVFGDTQSGRLDDFYEQVQAEAGSAGVLTVLQSKKHPCCWSAA